MSNCIICLDEVLDSEYIFHKINPECDCRSDIHKDCLNECVLSGLLCPICRLKPEDNIIIRNERRRRERHNVGLDRHNEPLDLRFFNLIIEFMHKNLPPLYGFIFVFLFACFVTIVYLLPKYIGCFYYI